MLSIHSGSSSSSLRVTSPPMLIPEIPPFKKPQPKPIVNPSPPKIPEIPAFKPRKSKDWEPNQMTASSDEHQLQLPTAAAAANPEWARRLKGADSSVIHRSVDCIANKVSRVFGPMVINVVQNLEFISYDINSRN